MKRRFKIAVLALGVWSAAAVPIVAKPAGLPTMPDTEFKVLPPSSQDFFLEEYASATNAFVPSAPWLPSTSVSGVVGGLGAFLVTTEPREVMP